MAKKKRFIHIGYPKCASTSLQHDVFAPHPDIYYLGWGYWGTESQWIDDDIAASFEVDLRLAKVHQYDIAMAKQALDKHFSNFEYLDQYTTLGLSWESLCFTFARDVDPSIKASRLFDLFGYGTKIVIVVRNQYDLIRSMYFEMVRDGMAKPFEEYLEFLHYHPYASLTEDLKYADIVKIYGDLFGYENLMVVPFEALIADQQFYINLIFKFVDAAPLELNMEHRNASNDLRKLEHIRRYNADHKHNFGREMFSFLDAQKLTTYWRREGIALSPGALAAIDAQKNALSEAERTFTPDVPKIEAEYSPTFHNIFHNIYSASNRKLASDWKLNLKDYGYPV